MSMIILKHNVRIQKDRKHRVISNGPYKYVRHPGYIAFIFGTISVPLLIGSSYGILIALVASLLITIRTYMEDKTLQKELHGYTDYAKVVQYKLIPGIW